jgi:AcrR family transcriptional regulator
MEQVSENMASYKKSAEMRKSIVETMALLVRKNGYEKTNIRDISEYLNIPRSLIYYYFKNKDDIMHVLYYERFSMTEQLAEKVLPRGEEPLVRLMLKYLLYCRNVICDPLFAEYIATAPEYASRGKEFSKDQIALYYDDSRDAFAYFGKPTDGNEFYIYALMVESIARGLVVGSFYGMIELSDREYMTYFGERAIMPTFDLSKEEFQKILDRAFELADRAKEEN